MLTNPIPGPPASVLSAALVAAPAFGPSYNQSGRATINGAGPSYPDLPSLMTDVVSMTGSATLDLNMLITGLFASQGWATQGVTTVTGNYTPLPTDAVILANAAGGAVTVTLPDATGPGYVPGQRYTIIKTDSSANPVTVAGSAGQLIDGAATVTLTAANAATSVVFDGVITDNWWVWGGITSLTAALVNPTFSKTANYSANPADFVICNIFGGSFTVTLPSAPANGTVIGAKVVSTSGTNTLTVACSGADVFDIPSGSTTRTMNLLNQASLYQYFAGPKIWYGLATNVPVSDLDSRYITQSTLTTLGDTLYENATPAPARLAGPTAGTVPYALTSTPSAGVAQAPAWSLLFDATTPAATSTTGATGSAATSPRRDHVHAQNYGGIFGDGSHGAVTLDGTTTYPFATLAGSTYTLTGDVFATNLTLNNGVTLAPNGWRVFCQGTWTDQATSAVNCAGGNGNANGNAGAVSGGQGTLGHGVAGGAGATAAGAAGGSVNGAGLATAGAGGSGASGGGGAGGTAGNAGMSWFKTPAGVLATIINVAGTNTPISGAPSGGGGGGDGTVKGGGGGGGGGVFALLAWAIVHNGAWNVSGGNGGTPASGNAGGGGAASGGLILTYSLSAPTGSGTSTAAGGTAGGHTGTGASGTAGGSGTVLNQVLS